MKDKILIQFDKKGYQQQLTMLQNTKIQLQAIVNAFCDMKSGISITLEELISLHVVEGFSRPLPNKEAIERILLLKMFPDGKINGLPIDFDKIKDMVIMPDQSLVVKAIIESHRDALNLVIRGYFIMDNSKVDLVPNLENNLHESFKTYAENAEEVERFEKAKVLAGVLNDICGLSANEINDIGDLTRVVELSESGQFVPNLDFIKTGHLGQYVGVIDLLQSNRQKQPVKTPEASIPGFSDEFLKQMGLENIQDPAPETGPDHFSDHFKTE